MKKSKPWEPLTDEEITELPTELQEALRPRQRANADPIYFETPIQSLTMTPSKFRKLWPVNP